MRSVLEAQQVLRWLGIVRWIALADLVLLIVLLVASFANNEEMVQISGLTHGIVFLALIAIVGIGAVQKLWSWWFLIGTLITTGPGSRRRRLCVPEPKGSRTLELRPELQMTRPEPYPPGLGKRPGEGRFQMILSYFQT